MTKARTLADMISDGVIGTTELADDVITPVKLDETGNYQMAQLGIGTSSPSTPLHVSKAGNGIVTFERSNKTSGSGYLGFNVEGNSQATIAFDDGGGLSIGRSSDPSTQAGYSNDFFINSSGQVGIGTSSPSQKLTISGGTSDVAMLWNSTDTAYYNFGILKNGSLIQMGEYNNAGDTLAESIFNIEMNGNKVGVGTTTPSHPLTSVVSVASSSPLTDGSNYALAIQNTDSTAGNAVSMAFGHGGYSYTNFISSIRTGTGTDPKGDLIFGGRPSDGATFVERMRITSSGEVKFSTGQHMGGATSFPSWSGEGGYFKGYFNGGGSGPYHRYLDIAALGDSSWGGIMRFITNPNSSGTGQERMRITQDGNVGIGRDNPIDKLNVHYSSTLTHSTTLTKGTNTQGLWVTNSVNDDNMAGIHLGTGGGTHFSSIVGCRTANASHWGTHLAFYTHNNDASYLNTATEKMRIDGAGRVTMPYQPSFSFPSSTNYSVTGTGYQYMNSSNVFANVAAGTSLNVGNHFNTSNGRFTAPVDGVYEFTLTYGVIYSSGYFLVYLEKNLSGSYYSIYNPTNQDGDWMFGTLNWRTFLYSGDFVTPMWNNNYSGGNIGHVKFSGHLIG